MPKKKKNEKERLIGTGIVNWMSKEEAAMMREAYRRPRWPFLPIKKRDSNMSVAVLVAVDNRTSKFLEGVNLWAMPKSEEFEKLFEALTIL